MKCNYSSCTAELVFTRLVVAAAVVPVTAVLPVACAGRTPGFSFPWSATADISPGASHDGKCKMPSRGIGQSPQGTCCRKRLVPLTSTGSQGHGSGSRELGLPWGEISSVNFFSLHPPSLPKSCLKLQAHLRRGLARRGLPLMAEDSLALVCSAVSVPTSDRACLGISVAQQLLREKLNFTQMHACMDPSRTFYVECGIYRIIARPSCRPPAATRPLRDSALPFQGRTPRSSHSQRHTPRHTAQTSMSA